MKEEGSRASDRGGGTVVEGWKEEERKDEVK